MGSAAIHCVRVLLAFAFLLLPAVAQAQLRAEVYVSGLTHPLGLIQASGTGVNGLLAYAFPVGGGTPISLGVPTTGFRGPTLARCWVRSSRTAASA